MLKITNQVCSEIYDIIGHMEKDLVVKLPQSFIQLISKNRDENYNVSVDYSKSINEQELLKPTRVVLSLIYRDYLCTEDKRKFLIEKEKTQIEQYEDELREKYNLDNLFKKNISSSEKEITDIIIYKETIFQKILKKLKYMF